MLREPMWLAGEPNRGVEGSLRSVPLPTRFEAFSPDLFMTETACDSASESEISPHARRMGAA